ncbi:MAG: dTDP-4-dehydrorhamnose 3,5-epimerase [Bacteroidota bacterium]
MGFSKLETGFEGLFEIQPDIFGDSRGFFMELFNQHTIGLDTYNFVQDNLSYSTKGALRGLHFQAPPHAQGKLVTVLEGSVLDVALDIRPSSPTYGKHLSLVLDSEKKNMLFIPPGFAHGFQVLSDTCTFFYKCTEVYHKASEGGVRWNDPALDIPWRDIEPVLSEKDKLYGPLSELDNPFGK